MHHRDPRKSLKSAKHLERNQNYLIKGFLTNRAPNLGDESLSLDLILGYIEISS